MIPPLAVLVEHRLVTDRQTQTDDRHRHRPMASTAHALHHAVKKFRCIFATNDTKHTYCGLLD